MSVSPARAAAFDILLRVERESSYASDLLHSPAYERLSTPDHALGTELVMGVLRWRSRLDAKIAAASSQPLSKLDIEILIALRLALYQFLWLDRVPQRAALHESVELVKRARKRSAASFVNAVLRKLSTASRKPDPSAESHSSPEAVAHALAHPLWLVERWALEYGLSAARQICVHNQSIPATAIRLRTPVPEQELNQEGITLLPACLLASALRVQSGDITHTQAFRTGQIVIQDEASQLVAALIGPGVLKKGSRMLDCCAAPGGKTLALADYNPPAAITAVELHAHRARLLQKLLRAHASQSPKSRSLPPTRSIFPYLSCSTVFSPTSLAPAPARSPAIPKSNGALPSTTSESYTSAKSQSCAQHWPKSLPADASFIQLVRWRKKKTKMSSSKL